MATKVYKPKRKISATESEEIKIPASSVDGLSTVATSGSYNDLSNKPTIPDVSGKANINGGNTFTGKQTLNSPPSDGYSIDAAGYVKGSWLQAPSTGKASSNTDKVCVLDGSGWVYYRTPAEIVSDGGGAKASDIPDVSDKLSKTENTGVNVLGTTKSTTTLGGNQLVAPNGIIFAGTAANAGLVTRGICGVTTPDSKGACSKENLYINYDGNNDFNAGRQVVLNAGAVGNHLGSNMYQYAVPRGDIVKAWVEAKGYLTSQDVSGKANLAGGNTFSDLQTINAPTNVNGSEQTTMKVKTSNGGAIIFGKEGANSGTMIRLDQTDGTCRLRFRSSATAGAMVWEQPESGAQLYVDLGARDGDYHRVQFPSGAGTLALTSQIPTKVSELTNDSGYTTNKGTVTQVKINGTTKSPNSAGLVDLGTVGGGQILTATTVDLTTLSNGTYSWELKNNTTYTLSGIGINNSQKMSFYATVTTAGGSYKTYIATLKVCKYTMNSVPYGAYELSYETANIMSGKRKITYLFDVGKITEYTDYYIGSNESEAIYVVSETSIAANIKVTILPDATREGETTNVTVSIGGVSSTNIKNITKSSVYFPMSLVFDKPSEGGLLISETALDGKFDSFGNSDDSAIYDDEIYVLTRFTSTRSSLGVFYKLNGTIVEPISYQ